MIATEQCKAALRSAVEAESLRCTSGMIYTRRRHDDERFIAKNLTERMKRAESTPDPDALLIRYREESGFQLAEKQAEAVKKSLTSPVSIITGGPGTGKTTTVRALLYVHKLMYGADSLPVLLAPTGRAARRMSEATDYPAATIHSAIGYHEAKNGDPSASVSIAGNLIIVDESSMMDQAVFRLLLERIPSNARTVFVGDPDQLPSVGCGNILHDLIASEVIPVTKLDVIYRQGADNPIIGNAHKINTGDTNLEWEKTFKLFPCRTPEETFRTAVEFYERCVNAYGLDSVILLNPYRKKTPLSVDAFNRTLQERINPHVDGDVTVTAHGTEFRRGDRVMQTKNQESAKNGDIGYIRDIVRIPDKEDPKRLLTVTRIEFNEDGQIQEYAEPDMKDVDLAYCTTVHKSQGSEYPTVLMVCSNLHKAALKRNLLYTGVTRAKENCALIGELSAIERSIQNNQTDVRHTLLASRLHSLAEE